MSANLLYSLSDENPKQTGCMNGILQHFLSGRAISAHHDHHKRISPGQSKMEIKETRQEMKVRTPRMSAESSSMVSSCSSASSTSRVMGMIQQPKSSINSHQLSIRSSRKQQIINKAIKHIDSPRPLQPPNLQNQRSSSSINTSRTEHLSSVKDKKKDGHNRRLSYDGRESRETIGLKLNELPRLSLDSRQGKMRSKSGLNSEFFQPEEPGSNRPVSSIVTKLMGLEDIPESTPRSRGNQARSRRSEDLDFLSRSTRSTDESDPDSERLSVSIYREVDKRLADLDFRKAGKDLRALKHILEAMQRTKSKMEIACNDEGTTRNSQNPNGLSKTVDKKLTKPERATDLPRVRTGKSADAKSDVTERRRTKDPSPRTQPKCGKIEKFSQERRARSTMMSSNQEPKIPTKQKVQRSSKNTDARSKKVVQRRLELDEQYDIVHTPRPSPKLYKTLGTVNVIEESTAALKEQPSPVSVLDAEFYGDESPSPVKKKATAFQDDYITSMSSQGAWIAVDTKHLSSSIRSCFGSDNRYNMVKVKETPNNSWLVKEWCTERSQIRAKSSHPSIEDENEFLTSIIAKDLARRSDCWNNFSSENSWLVLDIERLVFKDLIVELLHG